MNMIPSHTSPKQHARRIKNQGPHVQQLESNSNCGSLVKMYRLYKHVSKLRVMLVTPSQKIPCETRTQSLTNMRRRSEGEESGHWRQYYGRPLPRNANKNPK